MAAREPEFDSFKVKFTLDCPAQGNRNYIPVSDLYTRNFTDLNGEFQLELSMGHVRTVFDTEFRMPSQFLNFSRGGNPSQSKVPPKIESSYFNFGGFDWNLALYPHGTKDSHSGERKKDKDQSVSPQRPHSLDIPPSASGPTPGTSGERIPRRKSSASPQRRLPDPHNLELPSTSYSNARYNRGNSPQRSGDKYRRKKSGSPQRRLPQPRQAERPQALEIPDRAVTPGSSPTGSPTSCGESRVSFYLNRCTGFDHQCRVQYSVTLGDGDRRVDSGVVDDVSDSDGKSYGWHPRSRFSDLIYKGAIRVHLEMILANTLSEVIANIVVQQNTSASNPMGVVAQGMTQCYDRDKQAWSIKTDSHSDTVRLHMVYKEIHNVPRNHLRYVSWTAYVLRYHGKQVEPIPLPGAPFSHYYAQDVSDEGIIMETDIGMKELREQGCPYLSEKGQLRIQVEWEESYLLFQSTYHKYDDVGRMHNQQMRKEIQALQAENYSLERQLFSYQKSIAFAHSRGQYSDDLVSPEGRGDEEDERFFEERAYSLGDRSLSTDTEYA